MLPLPGALIPHARRAHPRPHSSLSPDDLPSERLCLTAVPTRQPTPISLFIHPPVALCCNRDSSSPGAPGCISVIFLPLPCQGISKLPASLAGASAVPRAARRCWTPRGPDRERSPARGLRAAAVLPDLPSPPRTLGGSAAHAGTAIIFLARRGRRVRSVWAGLGWLDTWHLDTPALKRGGSISRV